MWTNDKAGNKVVMICGNIAEGLHCDIQECTCL